ncbi:MAG: glycosyltransferase, partial [Rhodospirillaceae bacterium]
MKILIVSWYFPPCSTMGALRVGKFAKYLVGEGHDVRIVCARDQPYAMDHPVEVPAGIIHYTPWWDVNWLPAKVQSLRVWLGGRWRRITQQATAADASGAASSGGERVESRRSDGAGFLRRVLNFYRHATNIPDGMIGWLLPALLAARTVTTGWTPDIVFASAPPFTTLIAGRMIAKRVRAPLVVEYRDRWMEDPYGDGGPPLRRWIDRRLEKWCAAAACGVVTVSDPWADDYRARWNKPVAVAYNGYDPDDVAAISDATPADSDKLVILYTGIIYPERRDPTPLFEALALMGDDRKSIRVDFL